MPGHLPTRLIAALTLTFLPAAALADDRPPTAEERTQIESALQDAGYATWEEIEMDDGLWEVDDARKPDDQRDFDLKLEPQTFEIVSEREDD